MRVEAREYAESGRGRISTTAPPPTLFLEVLIPGGFECKFRNYVLDKPTGFVKE